MHLHPDYAFLEHYRKIQAQYIIPSKPEPEPSMPKGIKPITRYETPDGAVHDSESDAALHLRYLSIKDMLEDMRINWRDAVATAYLARYLVINGYDLKKIEAP